MEKTVIAHNELLETDYRNKAKRYVNAVQNNINVFQKYGLNADVNNVITCTSSLEAFVNAFVDAELDALRKKNLRGSILNAAEKEARNTAKFIAAQELLLLDSTIREGARFAEIKKGEVICISDKAIKEATTSYLEPEYEEDYKNHIAAAEALNKFFAGAIEHERELQDYFAVINGKIEVYFGSCFDTYPPRAKDKV